MNEETIERLLDEVLGLETEADRKAFLDATCKKDAALGEKLEALVNRHQEANKFFDDIEVGFDAETQSNESMDGVEIDLAEKAGSVIGRFTLLEKIGEGGMGEVYMAEQTEPVTRKVALKIIKLGMDTNQVIARFQAERQALALMDHPNIARVLDGGATDTGRPYFVMELVNGIPITEFCDKNNLTTKERIELFLPICKAIQSAHQKGIIHRDIKPSNVLVSFLHGEAIAKVIDFGIAKATHQKLTEKTLFTRFGAMMGTPAYMSPEQAAMSVIDVDTRTDVYSLGVLLYELLTGTTPFPEKRLRSAGYAEIQRIIAEEEPEKPSTRLSKTKDVVPRAEGNQPNKSHPADWALDKDLDWVTMKCLEKDRRRRYESATDLATDLKRHLDHEPVLAAAPSLTYQFEKFYHRHKGLVRTAIFTSALLIVTTAVSVGFAIWNAKLRKEADTAKQAAQDQTIELENNLYVSDMLAVEDAVAKEEFARAEQILLQHRSEGSGRDLRGFEWRFYWHQSRGNALRSFQAHDNKSNRMAVNRSEIGEIQFLKSGRQFLSAGNDRKLKLWNPSNDQPVHEWDGWGGVLSPSEEYLGMFNPRREVEVWHLPSKQLIRSGYRVDRQINRFQFTHDNQNMVLITSDRERGAEITPGITVVNIFSGEEVFTPRGLWMDYAVSPTAPLIWTVGTDQRTSAPAEIFTIDDPINGYLWNYEEKTLLHAPVASHGMGARFSPSGDLVTISYSDEPLNINANIDTHIYDVATGEQVSTFKATDLGSTMNTRNSVAFSSNEDLLAAPSYPRSKTIDVWEVSTGNRLTRYTGHSSSVHALQFHPLSDDILISISSDRTLQYWNCQKNQTLERFIGRASPISSLGTDEMAQQVVTGGYDGWLSFWPPYNLSPTNSLPNAANNTSFPIFSRRGTYLVLGERAAGNPPSLRYMIVGPNVPPPKIKRSVFETKTAKRLWEISRSEKALGFSPDESLLLTVSTNQFFARKVADGSAVRQIVLEEPLEVIDFDRPIPRTQALAPDGSTMATFNKDETIRLISLTTGKTIAKLDQRCSRDSVGFTPSGDKLFFTNREGGTSGVWKPSQGSIVWLKTTEDGWPTQRTIPSPDEKLIAGICYDKSIRIWNLTTGELIQEIKDMDDVDAFFTPDNRTLVVRQSRTSNTTRLRESTLKLFDRLTWRQIAELKPPRDSQWVSRKTLSPNGRDMMYNTRSKIKLLSTPTLREIDTSIQAKLNQ